MSCDEIICRFIEIQVDRHLLGHWPRSPDGGEGRRLSVDCRLIASDGGWPAPGLRNTLAGWGWADDGIDLASEESGAAETERQPGTGQTPDTVIMATY